jgi:hypothetical protein
MDAFTLGFQVFIHNEMKMVIVVLKSETEFNSLWNIAHSTKLIKGDFQTIYSTIQCKDTFRKKTFLTIRSMNKLYILVTNNLTTLNENFCIASWIFQKVSLKWYKVNGHVTTLLKIHKNPKRILPLARKDHVKISKNPKFIGLKIGLIWEVLLVTYWPLKIFKLFDSNFQNQLVLLQVTS